MKRKKKNKLLYLIIAIALLLIIGAIILIKFTNILGNNQDLEEVEQPIETEIIPTETISQTTDEKNNIVNKNEYSVYLDYSYDFINCMERVTYVNSSDETIYSLEFDVPEFMTINGVSVNGIRTYYELSEKLTVPLVKEINSGESVSLLIEYSRSFAQIPQESEDISETESSAPEATPEATPDNVHRVDRAIFLTDGYQNADFYITLAVPKNCDYIINGASKRLNEELSNDKKDVMFIDVEDIEKLSFIMN